MGELFSGLRGVLVQVYLDLAELPGQLQVLFGQLAQLTVHFQEAAIHLGKLLFYRNELLGGLLFIPVNALVDLAELAGQVAVLVIHLSQLRGGYAQLGLDFLQVIALRGEQTLQMFRRPG